MNKTLRLQQCGRIILEGLESINKINRAFLIIKEMNLYEGEYIDFNKYCQMKWNAQEMC